MTAGPLWDDPDHLAWLQDEGTRLLDFAVRSRASVGFGWLDGRGRLVDGDAVGGCHTWITARMTYVFSLAAAQGLADPSGETWAGLVDHGLAALTGPLRDREHDGWFTRTTADGDGGAADATRKAMYPHAFVLLAASAARAAGRPGAGRLLTDALGVVERRFWREDEGGCVESWDREWTTPEPYRGANSAMHAVEAFLVVADVTGDDMWRGRALRMADRIVHQVAREHEWRVVEHFDAGWNPLPEYGIDRPDDPFRPYGGTIGHGFEWSRLLVQLDAALRTEGGAGESPPWLLAEARQLFAAAVRQGWQVDGEPGLVYTVDWQGRPVVRTRMHWVLAEAILAAAALGRARDGGAPGGAADPATRAAVNDTVRPAGVPAAPDRSEPTYADWYRRWWDHARQAFVDRDAGSWHHELDPSGAATSTVWQGKPDVYHAYQAVLFPRLPLAPSALSMLGIVPRR